MKPEPFADPKAEGTSKAMQSLFKPSRDVKTKHLVNELFAPPLHEYPENMRDHVARMRVKLRRRRAISLVLSIASYMAIVCVLVFSALFIAMATDRDPPTSAQVKITTPIVRPGGKLSMSVLIDRKRICASRVTFRIFDGDGRLTTIEMPWHDAAGNVGIDAPFVRTLTIPPDAVPGVARLRIERSYRCPLNPFHKEWPITETDTDQFFDIVER